MIISHKATVAGNQVTGRISVTENLNEKLQQTIKLIWEKLILVG